MSIPSFRGRHNANKAKVFLFLVQERKSGRWYRAIQLHNTLGVPLRSLTTRLPVWCRWRRIKRRVADGYFEYHIAYRGTRWFNKWRPFIPIQRYIAEIEAWQSKNNPEQQGKGY